MSSSVSPHSNNSGGHPSWQVAFARWLFIRASLPMTLALTVLASVGFYFGSQVDLRLSMTDLLPDDYPAVVKFQKLTDVVGGVGFFAIVLDAADGKSHLEIAPKVIEEVLKTPLLKSASFQRERRFFTDRMLYYLPVSRLTEMETNLKKQITLAREKVFDLGLRDESTEKKDQVFDDSLTALAKESAKVTQNLTSKDGKTLLIMAKPSFDSTDVGKCRELIAFVDQTLRRVLPANVTFRFAERYYFKTVELDMIQSDIFVLGTLSILTIALVIWWYFQSFRAMLLIFVPVFLGLGITMGFASIAIGHINIVTGFLIGILSGLGVDYSIHMFLRYKLERREPSSDDPDPAWRALASTGHSVFVGAMAAAGAFFFLTFSQFRAFSEFGLICGVGIVSVFVALLLSYKTLSRFFEGVTLPENTNSARVRFPVLSVPRGLMVGTAVTAILFVLSFRVSFLYDFDRMMKFSPEIEKLARLVDEIYGRSAVPSAVATKTKQQALDLEAAVRKDYMPKYVNEIVSGASIIPENQGEKEVILARMGQSISKLRDRWIEGALGVPGSAVRRWLTAKPFAFEEIPPHVQDSLRGAQNSGYLVYLYPALRMGVYDDIKLYASMFKDLEKRFPAILTGSDAVIFSDILDLIARDGMLILMMIFVGVGFFIWVNVRKWNDTLLSYLPLLIALPVGMGLMVLFGVQFNIVNITIIPSFVALGIDVPIHIVHRSRETGSGFKAVGDIAPSVNLALLTAILGFGVLVFARAGVLRSLGWIALLGTVAIWWVGLFMLPAFIEWTQRRAARKMDGGSHGGGAEEKQEPVPMLAHRS